jgi:hypothetical protein
MSHIFSGFLAGKVLKKRVWAKGNNGHFQHRNLQKSFTKEICPWMKEILQLDCHETT